MLLGWCSLDIAIAWGCTIWNGALWQACSDRAWPYFMALLLLWLLLTPVLSVAQSLGNYRRKQQAWHWRCQLLERLIPILPKAQQANIDCPEQRLAEDSLQACEQGYELACTLLRDLLQAIFFSVTILHYPLVLAWLTRPDVLWDHWLVRPCLLLVALSFAVLANLTAVSLTKQLTKLQRLQQRLEGRMRRQLQQFTLQQQAHTDVVQRIDQPTMPHRLGSITQTTYRQAWRLTILSNLYQHLGLALALVLALPSYFAGQVEVGTAMAWMGSFRMVQLAVASLLQHWPMLTTCLAAIDRLGELALENPSRAYAHPPPIQHRMGATPIDGS